MVNALGDTRESILAQLAAGRTGLASLREGVLSAPLGFETAVGEVTTELPELPRELAARSTRSSFTGIGLKSVSNNQGRTSRPLVLRRITSCSRIGTPLRQSSCFLRRNARNIAGA